MVRAHLRGVEKGTWMADLNLGETFYNFCLDKVLRPYTGVELSKYFLEEITDLENRYWMLWTWLLMGIRPSPYHSTRHLLRVRSYLMGDRQDPHNPFGWDRVMLNLPGMRDYDPRKP